MRPRLQRSRWGALALLAVAVAAGSAMAASSGRSVSSARGTTLTASVPRLVFAARDSGALGATRRLEVALPLRLAHPAALDRLAAAESTPGSADYRHFLTPAEFGQRFGAPTAELRRAVEALKRLGLEVAPPAPNHLLVSAIGTVGTLERAFRVRMDNFRLPSGHSFYANTADITLPPSLKGTVTGVVGLDDAARPQPRLRSPALATARHALADRLGARAPKGKDGGATPCPAAVGSGGYTAPDLAQAYDYNGMYAKGFHGEGMSAALAEFDDFHKSNVATMESCYGVHTPVTRRLVDGGVGGPPEGGEAEDMADITTILELDPRLAHLYVYEAPITGGAALLDEGTAELDLYNAYVKDDKAPVISVSWGYCEQLQSASYDQLFGRIAEEAAVQGQQILDASGDSGAVDCLSSDRPTLGSLSVEQESAVPWVTGVGGTDLGRKSTLPGSPIHDEATWNDAAAAGGGQSAIWTMPSWQASYLAATHDKVPGQANDCGAPKGHLCRMVPDIAMNADPLAGVVGREGNPQFKTDMGSPGDDFYCGTPNCNLGSLVGVPLPTRRHPTGGAGGWQPIGGTSLSAPTAAAAAVLWDQQAKAAGLGRGFGFLNPALYRIASDHQAYARDFHDITSDSNSDQYDSADCPPGCNPHHFYKARTGYDMASGLGSVDVAHLGADLVKQAGDVALTPSLQTVYGYLRGPSTTAPVSVTSGYRGSTYTATSDAAWLHVAHSGRVPGTLSWQVDPRGLSAGTRTGLIQVRGKNGSTAVLTVRYAVTPKAHILVSPRSLHFFEHAIKTNGARTQPKCGATIWNDELKGSLTSSAGTPVDPRTRRTLRIANTGPAGSVLHYSAFFHTRTSSWLTEDLNPRNNPNGFQTTPSRPFVPTVGAVKTGRPAAVRLASIANANGSGGYPPMNQGTYTGVVDIRDLADPSVLVKVPAKLVLGNGKQTPTIAAAPRSIKVTLAPGKSKRVKLVLSDASHKCGYAYSLQVSRPWVKVSQNLLSGGVRAAPAKKAPTTNDSGEGNGFTPLTISAKGLSDGVYHARVIVQSQDAVHNPTIVPITLRVGMGGVHHGVRDAGRPGGFTG